MPSAKGGGRDIAGSSPSPQATTNGRRTVIPPAGYTPPYSLVIGVACALLLLSASRSTLQDVDLYWHIVAGRELAGGANPTEIGTSWSFAPADSVTSWASTQWLAELIWFHLHQLASWEGLAAFRVITAALTLGILARTTLAGRSASLAAWPFLAAALPVALTSQERPQQFTYIGAAVMGGVLLRGMAGSLPRWWLVALGTILWANLHGGWVLVPAVLALVTLARLLDFGKADSTARRAALLALLAGGCGAFTPAGLSGLTAVLRLARSTGHLAEWQPTEPMTVPGSVTLIMLGIFLVGWSRPGVPPRSEYLVTFLILLFSWTAWRNMVPALLMLAPLGAARLALAFPLAARRPEPGWSAPVGVAIAAVGLLLGLLSIAGRDNLPETSKPVALARLVADLGSGQRVLNDYNVSGLVLYFGGPGTTVSIDGRADRYRPEYVEAHANLMDLSGDWESLLARLAPTSALIKQDSALAHVLVTERGWQVVAQDDTHVLLQPDASTGRS